MSHTAVGVGMQVIEVTAYSARSAVITLRRRETPLKFVLFPMTHVASPAFYRQITQRLTGCDLIVLEGIKGKSAGISTLTMAYRFAPRRSRNGLVEQDSKTLLPPGIPVITPDLTATEAMAQIRKLPAWLRWILFVAAPIYGLVFAIRGPRAFLDENAAIEDLPTTREAELAQNDRLDEAFGGERDRRLIAALGEIHQERQQESITVGVVYGAAHVPAIVSGMAQLYGYRPREAEWVTLYVSN